MFTYITTTTVPSFPGLQDKLGISYSQVNWCVPDVSRKNRLTNEPRLKDCRNPSSGPGNRSIVLVVSSRQ